MSFECPVARRQASAHHTAKLWKQKVCTTDCNVNARRFSSSRHQSTGRCEDRAVLAQWMDVDWTVRRQCEDIRSHAVPIDLDSIRAFRTRPFTLDLYVWQSWRSWRIHIEQRAAVRVPIHGANGLRAQIGSQYKSDRRFMQQLRTAQEAIRAVWQECPNPDEPEPNRPPGALPLDPAGDSSPDPSELRSE